MKIAETKQIEPSYEERVKEKSVFDLRSNKTPAHKAYDSTIINSCCYGLNHDDGDSFFSAIKIDEADAFTLDIREVAIIPKQLLLDIINGAEAPENLIKLLKGT